MNIDKRNITSSIAAIRCGAMFMSSMFMFMR